MILEGSVIEVVKITYPRRKKQMRRKLYANEIILEDLSAAIGCSMIGMVNTGVCRSGLVVSARIKYGKITVAYRTETDGNPSCLSGRRAQWPASSGD